MQDRGEIVNIRRRRGRKAGGGPLYVHRIKGVFNIKRGKKGGKGGSQHFSRLAFPALASFRGMCPLRYYYIRPPLPQKESQAGAGEEEEKASFKQCDTVRSFETDGVSIFHVKRSSAGKQSEITTLMCAQLCVTTEL